MAATTQYTVVKGDPKQLVPKINALLAQGWVLAGGPMADPSGQIIQALTLTTGS